MAGSGLQFLAYCTDFDFSEITEASCKCVAAAYLCFAGPIRVSCNWYSTPSEEIFIAAS